MRILVTGANGYLGQGIVNKLLNLNHVVIATDIKIENIDTRAKRYACNIFEIDNPFEYFDRPDVLLHLAWRDGFVHYSDAHIEDLPKHYKLIKKFVSTEINKIAVLGSMHEIGFYEGEINENTPCNPVTPYGISKNALRELTKMLCEQNNKLFQWLRGYYIVGNTTSGSSIFSKIVKAINENNKVFPFTSGNNKFDFIDYDDFCNYIALSVTQNKVTGVVDICSGTPESLGNRVERFIKDNNYDIKLEYGVYPERAYESKAMWGNNTKIQTIINNYRNGK